MWEDWEELTESSSPGLGVISEDIEKGVDAGFELPGSKNVGEMGNVAFPPVREKTGFIRQQQQQQQLHDIMIAEKEQTWT